MKLTTKIDGKEFSSKDKFKWQQIEPGTDIVWFDDPSKDFSLKTLFSGTTDGLTIERKYLPRLRLLPEESPKWLICSNHIIENKGTSNIRRQFPIEFGNYYSSKIVTGTEQPIREEHGGLFYKDWNNDQWNKFFSFMLESVCMYLNTGLIHYEFKNISRNELIQKTNKDFVSWMEEKNYQLNKRYDTENEFNEFISIYYGGDSKFKQRGFTNWVGLYADSKNWTRELIKSNGRNYFLFTEGE